MKYHLQEFKTCNVTLVDFTSMIESLKINIGPCITSKIESRERLGTSEISRVRDCAAIVNELKDVKGFSSVAKAIRKHRGANPYVPRGQWFQLLVAYILKVNGYGVELEQSINDCDPKDILIPDEKIMIECKCFERTLSDRSANRLKDFIKTGKVPSERENQPDGFTTKTMLYPVPPGIPMEWVPTNHYLRFCSKTVVEKYDQLLDDWCNIIAFNTEEISQNLNSLNEPLEELLQPGNNVKLSGFLMVHAHGLSSDDNTTGQRYEIALVGRPSRDGISIPNSFEDITNNWNERKKDSNAQTYPTSTKY